MKLLVHVCCGPCAITVLEYFKNKGHDVTGLFFNPNIQPLAEYMKRREGAWQVAAKVGIPLIMADALPLEEQLWEDPLDMLPTLSKNTLFAKNHLGQNTNLSRDFLNLPPAVNPKLWLDTVGENPAVSCPKCWYVRLGKTAQLAKKWDYEAFSATLLYSRHQNHELLKTHGTNLARYYGLSFEYEDFRKTWQEGIDLSKEWGIYRQSHCGCMYSEYQRYQRTWEKASGYVYPDEL